MVESKDVMVFLICIILFLAFPYFNTKVTAIDLDTIDVNLVVFVQFFKDYFGYLYIFTILILLFYQFHIIFN